MNTQQKKPFLFLFFLIVFLLSACSSAPTPLATPTSITNGVEPAPYPINHYPNPYPDGNVITLVATAGPIPTPGQDTGVVTGRFLGDNKPVANAILYLAEVKKGENNKEMMAAYSEIDSPKAYTDANGNFVFANIPPGKYGMVLNVVAAEYLLQEPKNSSKDLLFIVEAGKTLNLGDLAYTDLPIE